MMTQKEIDRMMWDAGYRSCKDGCGILVRNHFRLCDNCEADRIHEILSQKSPWTELPTLTDIRRVPRKIVPIRRR